MEHDDDFAVCAATDLCARLGAQLDRARARRRAAQLQLDHLTTAILDGSIDYPVELVAQLQETTREVTAIELVMADLLEVDGGPHAACA